MKIYIYIVMEEMYDGQQPGHDLMMTRPIAAFRKLKDAQEYLRTRGTPGRLAGSYRRVDENDYVYVSYVKDVSLR